MAKKRKPTKLLQSWIVRARVEADIEYVTEPCTEEEARTQPDAFSVEETMRDIINLTVLNVEPND